MAQGLSLLVNATHEQLGILSKKNRQKIFFYSYSLLFMNNTSSGGGHSFCMFGLFNHSYGTAATNSPETERMFEENSNRKQQLED